MRTLNKLATVAQAARKPRKKEAQEIIQHIAELYPEHLNNLALLYNYFMPAIPKRPKTPFNWVATAAGVADVRYYLNYIYVTEKRIVATDGNSLHVTKNVEKSIPGYYLSNGAWFEKCSWARYPDIDRVLGAVEYSKAVYVDVPEHPEIVQLGEGMFYKIEIPGLDKSILVHRDRLEKLFLGMNDRTIQTDGKWIHATNGHNRALLLAVSKSDDQ